MVPPADAGPDACCCDLPVAYSACCGRWHAGMPHLAAPDAPTLMRSRDSAYVLGLRDDLLDTSRFERIDGRWYYVDGDVDEG